MPDEAGQATIEWVALVLAAALALGALAAFRAPAEESRLGKALAQRLTCAPARACSGARSQARSGSGARPAGGTVGGRRARGGRAERPRAGPGPGAGRPRVSRSRAVDAFRRLRGVGELTKRIWIVCLGYRRFIHELDHPRAPTEVMSVDEAIEIANDCLNPAAFLGEE